MTISYQQQDEDSVIINQQAKEMEELRYEHIHLVLSSPGASEEDSKPRGGGRRRQIMLPGTAMLHSKAGKVMLHSHCKGHV